MGKSFILASSSFSPGLFLFLLTVDIFPGVQSYWLIFIKFLVLTIILIAIANISLWSVNRKLDEPDTMLIKNIQPIENDAIPTYLGLFIIMLSLGTVNIVDQVLIVITIFLIWWLFMERSYYFNMIWLMYYRYYKVQDNHGNTYSVYSKRRNIKLQSNQLNMSNLQRINNFTFIERKLK